MVKEVYNHYGRIDILINNAGQGFDGPVEHIGIKEYHYIIDLNLIGPLIAMQEVIPCFSVGCTTSLHPIR